ncbi:Hypothetical protein POVR1_LOCUS247 [uncultured virus]|nr:Hypothetical protein POVR1_LOCUS247 [uncultured virus]
MAFLLIPAGVVVVGLVGYKIYGSTAQDPSSNLYLSETLNGKSIGQRMMNDLLNDDDEIITDYYYPVTPGKHGYLVCKTATSCFLTQLRGNEKDLILEIILVPWEPSTDMKIGQTNMSVKDFRMRVTQFADSFGTYTLEANDCRHFTSRLIQTLAAVGPAL